MARAIYARNATGLPVRAAVSDPGSDSYTASGLSLTRESGYESLRMLVGDSGIVVSLDGGTTDHFTLLPNTVDEVRIPISKGTSISVKRYTSGTAFTHCVLEVR